MYGPLSKLWSLKKWQVRPYGVPLGIISLEIKVYFDLLQKPKKFRKPLKIYYIGHGLNQELLLKIVKCTTTCKTQ